MSEDLEDRVSSLQYELDSLRREFDEFAYIVSHDMAAPFRQIDGFAEIILSNNSAIFDDKTKRHFDLIMSGSKRGSRLIEALLVYSGICTQALNIASVDCNEIVESVLEQLAPLIKDAKAEISCTEMPVVEVDQRQLKQLFFQLFHNALHYCKPGNHPVIELDVVESENCWEFRIKDGGIGVSDKYKDKIFAVLRRAVADKDYEGVGMGLAISKRIVQNHRGAIWVDSAGENGSTIHFTLPRKNEPA